MIALPIKLDTPHQTFSCDLDGVTYGFEVRWNARSEAFYMSIFTAEGDLIIANRKIVLDWPLFGRFADSRLPPGPIIATDTSGASSMPALDELGPDGRVLVQYLETT